MKLNITPGPWIAEYTSYVPPFKCSVLGGSPNDGATYILHGFKNNDITAIITAVNNTYHEGINPEAVPEMLEFIAGIARNPKNDTLPDFVIDDAKKLIQKATL